MKEKILLIEDEVAIADAVAYSLQSEGFDVQIAHDGLSGLSMFRAFYPDLILLDLMLPKLNGLDFCRLLRRESNVPIIMVTAKTEEIDRILGLELGADDYVCKPFSVKELIARVRAVLRRTEASRNREEKMSMQVGGIELDSTQRSVTVDGSPVHLPLKQFELLRVLMANKDRVLTRDELFKKVWAAEAVYDAGTLDVHIRWLRVKIEHDPSHPRYIKTMRGVGYRMLSGED